MSSHHAVPQDVQETADHEMLEGGAVAQDMIVIDIDLSTRNLREGERERRGKEALRTETTNTTTTTTNTSPELTLEASTSKDMTTTSSLADQHLSISSISSSPETNTNHADACVTNLHDLSNAQHVVNGSNESKQVIAVPPASPIVQTVPADRHTITLSTPPPSPSTTDLKIVPPVSSISLSELQSQEGSSTLTTQLPDSDPTASTHEGNMGFGTSGPRGSAGAHRRRNLANTNAITDEEADMTTKDRAKQKEAVARFLANHVKQDWNWVWPRPDTGSSSADEAVESIAREFAEEDWKERDEWSDNASDGAEIDPITITRPDSGIAEENPFRFDSPDAIGHSIKKTEADRKRRRRKRLDEEIRINEGLRCFTERRDAWTGARRVPHSAHNGLSKRLTNASCSSKDGGSSTAIEVCDDESDWEDTEIPVAPPLIPPGNAMRSSVTPASYNMIFDKVVTNHMAPMCPINLADITRSCVKGWQRDGTWEPPKTASTAQGPKKQRKLSVVSLFSRENSREEKTLAERRDDAAQASLVTKPRSPTGLRGKLGKILHLRKDGE